jgi:hypothetical protein
MSDENWTKICGRTFVECNYRWLTTVMADDAADGDATTNDCNAREFHSNGGHDTAAMADAVLQLVALRQWPTQCCKSWHYGNGPCFAIGHSVAAMALVLL